MSILLIDDTPLHRLALAGMLEDEGYTDLLQAASAAEAFKVLDDTDPATIDLVLTDLNMPEMDGIEVCRALKARRGWEDVPIIVVTSSSDAADLRVAFAAGAVDYITKPPNEVELLARVRSTLRLKQEMDLRKAREQKLLEVSQQLTDKNLQLTEMNQAMEKMFDSLAAHHSLLQVEQDKSERLLLNILPKPIAERLKQNEGVIADSFPEATVLFADIADFTPLAARMSPEDLIALLNEVFSIFDRLAEKHGLEKIKTIGDAYMAVAGVPTPRPDHAEAVADMALEMRAAFGERRSRTGSLFSLRIGAHTGPVVAGVIGQKKFIYDLWGDTVNMASRMESHGVTGSIQVTTETFERLQARYLFEARGPISIKGKGEVMTYFLVGRKDLPSG